MPAQLPLALFCLAAALNLAGNAFKIRGLRGATKPLLMPLLGAWYLASISGSGGVGARWLVAAALSCAFLGDVFLMLPNANPTRPFLKAGIAAFLAGHLCYIAVFAEWLPDASSVPPAAWLLLLPFLAGAAITARFLKGRVDGMAGPTAAYIAVITLMGLSTVLSFGSGVRPAAWKAVAGALLFMVSDIVNSYGRFVREPRWGRAAVMATYVAGQFLIVSSLIAM